MAKDFLNAADFHFLRGEAIFNAARGVDISQWSDDELKTAWKGIGKAFWDLERSEDLQDFAFDLRIRGLAQEQAHHESRCRKNS